MNITHHANQRADERIGWDSDTTARMAAKALDSGIRHSDVSGSLNRYLTKLYHTGVQPNNTRIYGEHVYLFKGTTLITIIPLPRKYRNAARRRSNP